MQIKSFDFLTMLIYKASINGQYFAKSWSCVYPDLWWHMATLSHNMLNLFIQIKIDTKNTK